LPNLDDLGPDTPNEDNDDDFNFDDAQKTAEDLDQDLGETEELTPEEEADIEKEISEATPEELAAAEDKLAREEKPAEEAPAKPQYKFGEKESDEVKRELIKKLGEPTRLKSKGKEYALKDLPNDEVVKFLQLGIRSDQVFRELAELKQSVLQEQTATRRAAEAVNQAMASVQQPARREAGPTPATLPPGLAPTQYDTEETLQLKGVIAGLMDQVQDLSRNYETQAVSQGEARVIKELQDLKEEYPMMSPEEVVAVKAMHRNIPLEEIAKVSHDHYQGKDHFMEILKHNPTLRREYEEEVIKNYRLALQNRKAVASKPTTGRHTVRPVPESQRTKKSELDFDKAEANARAMIKEKYRAEAEETES